MFAYDAAPIRAAESGQEGGLSEPRFSMCDTQGTFDRFQNAIDLFLPCIKIHGRDFSIQDKSPQIKHSSPIARHVLAFSG